jgi:retron-type reverse transcriptase
MTLQKIPFQKTTKLIPLIARIETLLLAYTRIKKNKGALAKGANVDEETFKNYSDLQKDIFFKKKIFPDGFSLRDLYIIRYLILKGQYPWGSSRRIWLEKPGDPIKKRPITIPPFLDRVVQEAIKMSLHAIWEPYFEKRNRSFGFRPNKSSHDAITALKSNYTTGLFTAIEGDIQGAYDNVNKKILLEQLSRRIEDKGFIEMMTKRLNYDYVDSNDQRRYKPALGIPQGGMDSPYLFNIYLSDLDEFVHTDVQAYLNKLNSRPGIPENKSAGHLAMRRSLVNKKDRLVGELRKIKTMIQKSKSLDILKYRMILHRNVKQIRLMQHSLRKLPYYDSNKRKFRFFYVRYADDWIILSNFDKQIAEKVKAMIKEFLATKLEATLSDTKTFITDIRYQPARFLGFELTRAKKGRLGYMNGRLQRAPGFPIIFSPDRQRLINKLHARGFCDIKGRPIDIPWISSVEAHIIIQRFNASMIGLMQYYLEWVSHKSSMHRWIYIIRYSCLKTIARKYRLTISKVFKRFGTDFHSTALKTIKVTANLKVGQVTYEKEWKLETYETIKRRILSQNRVNILREVFEKKEKGEMGNYP